MQGKERVIILIDGSNFYYSTVKKGKKINFQKLAKVLSGDGDIEITWKGPGARVKITDCNIGYLEDYKSIMEMYGFKPKI